MRKLTTLLFSLAMFSAGTASASVLYSFTLNTSSISGTTGSIDFGLYPGTGADQSLTAVVSNFSSTGSYAGSRITTGSVTGGPVSLGVPLTIVDSSQDNDDLETFHFGSTLSFTVLLNGPELTAPDGKATSADQFIFETYSDLSGTIPVLTADTNGYSGIVNVSPAGSVTTTVVSPQLTETAVPEPGTLFMLGSASVLLAAFLLKRRSIG